MGGSSPTEDDWELTSNSDANAITLVLMGKLGYGKSATGNSILGRKVFKSKSSMNGVTTTSQMESTKLNDGRIVNVIDTPGLFDWSIGAEEIGKEIVKCVNLAKDGVHAFIIVFSVQSRFSKEEECTLQRLQMFFGDKIVDYMILVFTGGDVLEEQDETFHEYLSGVPTPIQTIIQKCKNRVVIFDNKTKNNDENDAQVQQLLFCVDSVIANNGGKPFSDEIFQKLQGCSAEQSADLKKEIYEYNYFASILKMVEDRLSSMIDKLAKELAAEQAARLEAQKIANDAQVKSDNEIHNLKESLKKAKEDRKKSKKENQNFKKNLKKATAGRSEQGYCAIM